MKTTIPYDSSLSLGSVVCPAKYHALQALASQAAHIGAAEKALEAATATLNAFNDLWLESSGLSRQVIDRVGRGRSEARRSVEVATEALVNARVEWSPRIVDLQRKAEDQGDPHESPIDFSRTGVRQLPLVEDSIRMSGQYFSFASDAGDASGLERFVAGATSFLGAKRSIDLASTVSSQVALQRTAHDVEGTLIVTATCTHRNLGLLDPVVLDADKALALWNRFFPKHPLMPGKPDALIAAARDSGTDESEAFHLCTGARYGSSFIGMVHLLNRPDGALAAGDTFSDLSIDAIRRALPADATVSHCDIIVAGGLSSLASSRSGGVLDVRSLLQAFDDYVARVGAGCSGVPIKFMLSSVTRDQVARAWCERHMPARFEGGPTAAAHEPSA